MLILRLLLHHLRPNAPINMRFPLLSSFCFQSRLLCENRILVSVLIEMQINRLHPFLFYSMAYFFCKATKPPFYFTKETDCCALFHPCKTASRQIVPSYNKAGEEQHSPPALLPNAYLKTAALPNASRQCMPASQKHSKPLRSPRILTPAMLLFVKKDRHFVFSGSP